MPKFWSVLADSDHVVTSLESLKEALLQIRSIEAREEYFFEPRYHRDIHDPALLFGMDVAVNRIYQAISKDEHILVYGDYDADGITGTAIQLSVLRDLGARVSPWLPHRVDHGYGLNGEVLDSLSGTFDLLISVDCGVGNYDEVARLTEQGIDTIIVDHHTIPTTLPPALAVLHPQHPDGSYPFAALCGAGVSWKLASALLRDSRSPFHHDGDIEKWLLDLVCLGTVADMVSLTGENRAIVRFGLEVLRRTPRPGVQALLRTVSRGDVLTEEELGFRIIPMLNAAGRIEHPQPALDLLLASSLDEAERLVSVLKHINQRRRTLSKKVLDQAETMIDQEATVLFAASLDWPAGVVGLVAGNLSKKYLRPVFVVGGAGGEAVGSARAPTGVNVLEVLEAGKEFLIKYGGHTGAAGFSVKSDAVADFEQALLANYTKSADLSRKFTADMVIDESLLTWDTFEVVEYFAPYGEGNQKPTFILKAARLVAWRLVGKLGEHVKFTFRIGEDVFDAIGFGLANAVSDWREGKPLEVDVLFQLEANEFRGRRSLQMNVHDIVQVGEVVIQPLRASVNELVG